LLILPKNFDKIYDTVTGKKNEQIRDTVERTKEKIIPGASSGRRRQRNRLPSPEGRAPENWDSRQDENRDYRRRSDRRSDDLDRESEVSERVIREYESERDDPSRRAETVLSKRDLNKLNSREANMSYANGYAGGNNLAAPQYDRRASSQQPQRSRYYDDDDSDYDERSGRRYRTTGRGYDDGYEDDRGYDREIVETERYRGVSGALVVSLPLPSVATMSLTYHADMFNSPRGTSTPAVRATAAGMIPMALVL
jgi:hypothetical protein